MSSSIFSSEYLVAYWRLPRRTKLWHGALVLSSVLTVQFCSDLLRRNFVDARWRIGEAKVLCVGTSRIRDGLRPGVFQWPMAKLVYPVLDQATATVVVETHLELWPELRVAMIGLDEFSLLADAVQLHHENLSDICGSLDVSSLDLDAQADGEAWLARHWYRWRNFLAGSGSPWLHHRRRLTIANTVDLRSPTPAKRHRPRIIGESAAAFRVRYAKKEMFSSTPETAVRRNTEALVDLVAALRRREIEVVLLCLPCSRAYESERPASWDRLVDSAVALVRTRLGENACVVWDYRGDVRTTDDWFADVDHLGPFGSQEFSRLVDARIAAAGWLGSRATPR